MLSCETSRSPSNGHANGVRASFFKLNRQKSLVSQCEGQATAGFARPRMCSRIGLAIALLVPCRSVVLPFDALAVQSSSRHAFVMVTPFGCTHPVCQAMVPKWSVLGRQFPGVAWRADCSQEADASEPMCGRAAVDGVAFFVWNGQEWRPFKGERSTEGLHQSLQAAHQLLVRSYSEQLNAMFRALHSETRGEPRRPQPPHLGMSALSVSPGPSGVVEMPHDELPDWFRCVSYELVADGTTALDLLNSGDVFFMGQPHRSPLWKPWKFHWHLRSASDSVIEFSWHSEGLGNEEDSMEHDVRISADRSRRARLRHCELPRLPALFDEPNAERPGADPARTLGLTLDAMHAYDWLRFHYTCWAEAFGRRIRSHLRSQRLAGGPLSYGREAVFYDGMCGSAWLPVILKAQLPHTRFYLSDVSADAVALSRRNFEQNEFSATFLHGDLFSPMREVISRDPTARPHYIYLYPPQIPPEKPGSNDPRPGDPQPRVSVFTPTTAMHFFRRFAAELVDILAPGAIVWIGIDLPIVEEGRHIFQAAGWQVQDVPELLGIGSPSTILELTRPTELLGSQASLVSANGDW